MTAIQSTYSQYFSEAYAGNFAHVGTLDDWVSKITDTAISFGLGVVRGAKDNSVKVPAATGGKFIGIVRRTLARSNSDNASTSASELGTFHDIITNGYVYAVCEDGCSPGDTVYLRFAANTGSTLGSFRTDADVDDDSAATADIVTGATWETTTTAGEIGVIKLRQGV